MEFLALFKDILNRLFNGIWVWSIRPIQVYVSSQQKREEGSWRLLIGNKHIRATIFIYSS